MKFTLCYLFLFIHLFTFAQEEKDTLCPIQVSETITPDCDGIDCKYMHVVVDCAYLRYNLTVYNRWGEVIFTSNDINDKFDSSTVKQGMYIYNIHLQLGKRKKDAIDYKGRVNVLR